MIIAAGCIKNDLPYPHIQPNFTSFEVELMASPAKIDTINRVVTLTMAEEADLSAVHVLSYTVEPQTAVLNQGESVPTLLDLTEPWEVELTLYQTYTWTVTATQNIQRYFTVDGMIGQSTIDVPGRRAVAYVAKSTPLSSILVTSLKLGPEGSVEEPRLEGKRVDFTDPVVVTVTAHGRTEEWTVYVEHTDAVVEVSQFQSWSRVAWATVEAAEGADVIIEYRPLGQEEWNKVPANWITIEGGTHNVRLIHLQPETEYEFRATSGEDSTPVLSFMTDSERQMPNSNFSEWSLNGRCWNPWSEGDESPFWGTGNKGSAPFIGSITEPTDLTVSGTGRCAKLQTKNALITLATGNIFTGEYLRTDGTNGVLGFGREWTECPTRLTGYFHYDCATINQKGNNPELYDLMGRPDTSQIYIMLTDWVEPFEVRTKPSERHLISLDDPAIIAYGSVQYGQTISSWTPFTIELDYRTVFRKPKYILVVASSSKYGDYFLGGVGSTLYLDNFRLEYDY